MEKPLLFLALDVPDTHAASVLADRAGLNLTHVKVGLELFIAEGPPIVRVMRSKGKTVFLDLKLHDIPETVFRAAQRAASLGPDYITVHAAGGRAMLEAAVKGVDGSQTKVLAVTVLTSLDLGDLAAVGTTVHSIPQLVVKRALLAQGTGCHGVIASPREVRSVRDVAEPDFLIISPGVRLEGSQKADQKRVATPREAVENGANGIVAGRDIRDASNPAEAVERIFREMNGG
jgi:orotidine-5'-phosphate decarboxylase